MSPTIAPLGVAGWQVTVTPGATFDVVKVSQPAAPYAGQITPAGFVAVLSYLAGTYFTDADFPASGTDARLPQLQLTTGGLAVNVLSGDGQTVQAEIASLLAEAGNLS